MALDRATTDSADETAPDAEAPDGAGWVAEESARDRKRREAAERQRRKRGLDKAARENDPLAREKILRDAGLIPAAAPAPTPRPAPAAEAVAAPQPAASQSPEIPPKAPDASALPSVAPAADAGHVASEPASAAAQLPAAPSVPAVPPAAPGAVLPPSSFAEAIAGMDSTAFSALVVGAVDDGACKLLGDEMKLGADERALLVAALGPVLKKHAAGDKLTCEETLLLSVAIVYGPRVLSKASPMIKARMGFA